MMDIKEIRALINATDMANNSITREAMDAMLDHIDSLEAVAHPPVAIPLGDLQTRIEAVEEFLRNYGVFERLTRDDFAAAALASLVSLDDERITPERIAQEAYAIADAMIVQRTKDTTTNFPTVTSVLPPPAHVLDDALNDALQRGHAVHSALDAYSQTLIHEIQQLPRFGFGYEPCESGRTYVGLVEVLQIVERGYPPLSNAPLDSTAKLCRLTPHCTRPYEHEGDCGFDYTKPHPFELDKESGLKHTEYRVCKCGLSEFNVIHRDRPSYGRQISSGPV